MKKQSPVTFRPESDVEKEIKAIKKKWPRHVSKLINAALREQLPKVCARYAQFAEPEGSASFNEPDCQPVGEEALAA